MGIPTNKMSAKWAPKEFKLEKNILHFGIINFAAGKFGSGAIMDRMAKKIKENNKIYLNHEVIDFKYDDNKLLLYCLKMEKKKKLKMK